MRVRFSPRAQVFIMKQNQILISGAVVFRENRGKKQFFLVKQAGNPEWEIPKVTVRRGESSVRAVLRMTGEQGGMNTKVLEEAGRSSGTVLVNEKPVSQKFYYYLLVLRAAGEILGFENYQWAEYTKALREISSKKEKEILRSAKEVLLKWEKEHSKRKANTS